MSLPLIIAAIIFLLVFSAVMTAYVYMEEKYWRSVLARRLFKSEKEAAQMTSRLKAPWVRTARKLGQTVTPKKESETAALRKQLCYAGYREPQAVTVFFGIRIAAMLGFGVLYLVFALITGHFRASNLILVFLPLAAGYYLPVILLKIKVSSRQKQIFRELPDALDLVIICLEAGLGFDMALYRVSRELAKVSPVMAEEFGQYFLEIQSGLPRKTVLENLSERNGVESLGSVVGVLIQSIRFGTNIAESLRVHIRSMRTQRRQIAEEQGSKISTRLTFPMILLILPALFIVILGPALINIFMKVKGGGF